MDCWSAYALVWTGGDNRRRCNECFVLFAAIITRTATPAQIDLYDGLPGIVKSSDQLQESPYGSR